MKRTALLVIAIAGLAGLLLYGVFQLFALRFARGDAYPPYSSLRADPVGAKAFCEALGRLPAVSVRRHFLPLDRLRGRAGVTFLCVGTRAAQLEYLGEEEALDLEGLATRGRVVFCLYPSRGQRWTAVPHVEKKEAEKKADRKKEDAEVKDKAEKARGGEEDEDENEKKKEGAKARTRRWGQRDAQPEKGALRTVSGLERWGVRFGHAPLPPENAAAGLGPKATRVGGAGLPGSLSWHSTLYFKPTVKAWRTVYARAGRPVIIERPFGKGTMVLASDSYFLSNEALRKERRPRLLAWLVGPNPEVIFDEAHLGVQETPGVMTLAWRYRLHGFFAGLLLLAGLFVWRHGVRFVPPRAQDLRGDTAAEGRDAAAGFLNLLRRNVGAGDVLRVCFDEWKKTCGRGVAARRDRVERARAAVDAGQSLPAASRDPVARYRAICEILNPRESAGSADGKR